MLLVEGISPLLTADIIERCRKVGIRTVLDFISVDSESLPTKISIPYKDVSSIRRILLACYSSFPQSGDSLYEDQLQSLCILNTGFQGLDDFLEGGIYTGEITEIHGLPGSGKTQLCLSIVASLLTETGNSAIYLDTNGSFSSKRLEQLLLGRSKELQAPTQGLAEHMKRLRVINVYDIYGLFDTLQFIKDQLCKQEEASFASLKLLLLDSAAAVLAPCLGGPQLDSQGLVALAAQQLRLLCSDHALAVLVCNNMVRGKGCSEPKPALGRYWKHVPSVALRVERRAEERLRASRTVTVRKSCRKGTFGRILILRQLL